jgi:zinc D-Ala-D-Ala dipeptidase
MSLIDISPPAFDLDIALAYATPDNVTGRAFYRADARPYLHPRRWSASLSPSGWRVRWGLD